MILLLMGMKDGTSTHSCVWCTISKDERLLIFDTCSDIDYNWLYINSLQIALASYIANNYYMFMSLNYDCHIGGTVMFLIVNI